MKYIKQFAIILVISFLGEAAGRFIPLPVPASIYGLIFMLGALRLGVFHCSAVKETSTFLIEIMPLMFIPAAAGLLTMKNIIKPVLLPYAVITAVSTVLVMVVAGRVTQAVIRRSQKRAEAEEHE